MSIKLTKKQAENMTKYVFLVDCNKLYRILSAVDKVGYTAGTYGWNSDIYIFGDVTIIVDYRGYHSKSIPRPTDFEIEEIETRSDLILKDYKLKYWDQQEMLSQEREKWFEKLIEKYYWRV